MILPVHNFLPAWNAVTLTGTSILVAGYSSDTLTNSIALAEYDDRGTLVPAFGVHGIRITGIGVWTVYALPLFPL